MKKSGAGRVREKVPNFGVYPPAPRLESSVRALATTRLEKKDGKRVI